MKYIVKCPAGFVEWDTDLEQIVATYPDVHEYAERSAMYAYDEAYREATRIGNLVFNGNSDIAYPGIETMDTEEVYEAHTDRANRRKVKNEPYTHNPLRLDDQSGTSVQPRGKDFSEVQV